MFIKGSVGQTLRAKSPISGGAEIGFYPIVGEDEAIFSIKIDGITLSCQLTPEKAGILGTEMIRWTGWLRAQRERAI